MALPFFPLVYGQVLTAGQWNALFDAKQDLLGYTPLNRAGGTMLGRLVTAASTSQLSGFQILPGVAPDTPNDGDMWFTASGFFFQIDGTTVGPFGPSTLSVKVLSKSGPYTVTADDIAGGRLVIYCNAGSGGFDITIDPAVVGSLTSTAEITVEKVDTVAGNLVGIRDLTQAVDAIASAATTAGQIGGWRSITSNGTNLRSVGIG